MSNYYKEMPAEFKAALEVIKGYCQNEDCGEECFECPYPLSVIRCGDSSEEQDPQTAEYFKILRDTPAVIITECGLQGHGMDSPGKRAPSMEYLLPKAVAVKHDSGTRFKSTANQGDLVYITHPNPDRCGWYIKNRKTTNSKTGYFMVNGSCIGQFVSAKSIESPDWGFGGCSSRVRLLVKGENVAPFIASHFSDASLVVDLSKDKLRKEIEEKEQELQVLKNKLNEYGGN